MLAVWILLLPLLLDARAFLILDARGGRCLEASAAAGRVLLRRCDLDSEAQQWLWLHGGMLMSVRPSGCLWARQGEPVQTRSCRVLGAEAAAALWDCDGGRLLNRNSSMMLAADGPTPVLSRDSKLSAWKSLDEGDVCQEKLRSRRASDDPDELEAAEKQAGGAAAMTDEQREYLRWFYRTEDPTMWTFVLLGLAFVCLLVGFLLLGMGAMANKNRRKIAKYKAAAAQRTEELQSVSPLSDHSGCKPSPPLDGRTAGTNGELSQLKAGSVLLTWKDGNTSCLYAPDPAEEEENREENRQENREENREENRQENRQENREENRQENREENREELAAAEPTE